MECPAWSRLDIVVSLRIGTCARGARMSNFNPSNRRGVKTSNINALQLTVGHCALILHHNMITVALACVDRSNAKQPRLTQNTIRTSVSGLLLHCIDTIYFKASIVYSPYLCCRHRHPEGSVPPRLLHG